MSPSWPGLHRRSSPLISQPKEARTVPPSTGDSKRDFGEAVIGLPVPGKPVSHHPYPLRPPIPLADGTRLLQHRDCPAAQTADRRSALFRHQHWNSPAGRILAPRHSFRVDVRSGIRNRGGCRFSDGWFLLVLKGELAPHPSHASTDVDSWALAWAARGAWRRYRPIRALEQGEQLLGNKAGSRCINVPVTLGMLAVCEEALRHHQMEIVLCSRHRDVEKAAFLFQFSGGARSEVRRHAAVD